MIDICPICSSEEIIEIFQEDNVPVFQNKIYPTEKEARLAELGSIRVVLCRNCGFAWNASFDREKLQYDSKYQNEQSCSGEFRRHLDSVMQIIQENNPLTSHIIPSSAVRRSRPGILNDWTDSPYGAGAWA